MDPSLVMPEAKSVITLTLNYFPAGVMPEEDNYIIAKYAYGNDYHQVVKDRLERLSNYLRKESGATQVQSYVDSGPVSEKVWASLCGLGWQGKNTILINKTSGSFFFIGILFTNLDLEPDPASTDHCGDCEKCVRACPTGALDNPYQLNILKCIAYQTIENKAAIPEDIITHLEGRIYGCDKCQDVCPYNRFSKPNEIPEFIPSPALFKMRKKDWDTLSKEQFDALFSNSPIRRIGYERFKRNIEVAGN